MPVSASSIYITKGPVNTGVGNICRFFEIFLRFSWQKSQSVEIVSKILMFHRIGIKNFAICIATKKDPK